MTSEETPSKKLESTERADSFLSSWTRNKQTYASSSDAAGTPPKRKRSLFTRLLLYSSISAITLYGVGTVASLRNDGFRDRFTDTFPFAEQLVDYFEESNLPPVKGQKAVVAPNKPVGISSPPKAERKAAEVHDKAASYSEVKGKVTEEKHKASSAAGQVKDKASEKLEEAKQKGSDAKEKASETVEGAKDEAKEKAGEAKDKAAGFLDTLPPRSLDPSPQPAKEAVREDYTGPPLPLGFEPPPGYAVPRPKKPASEEEPSKSEVEAAPVPPPLPLVAPFVSDLSASEPVLGQLASTIDQLAAYLRDNPAALTKSAPGQSGTAADVLTTAQIDLQNLGKRLEAVKEEERAALAKRMEEQAKEYSSRLLSQERELVERLEDQEEDWKAAFDAERRALVDAYRSKLEQELEVQQEIINQRLKEEVVAQGIEMQRRWLRDVKLQVEKERGGRLGRLDELEKSVRGLGRVALDNGDLLDENVRIHTLWSAFRAVVAATFGEIQRPFFEELGALRTVNARGAALASAALGGGDNEEAGDKTESGEAAAADIDPIAVALDTITDEVSDSGVEPLSSLSSWFTGRVAPRIRSAALMPERSGVLSYLGSALLSNFMFVKQGFVEGEDDVYAVLARAEWYLSRRELEKAAREINRLEGWPRVLARDWLESARRHLEVKQALEVGVFDTHP
jgi:mitofilin